VGSKHQRQRVIAWLAAMIVAVVALTGCADSPLASTPANQDVGTFPRTATYWLNQDYLPSVDELARYDLIVMDSEWANRVDHAVFRELRQRNPHVILLAYVNLVDYPPRLGSASYYADRYALWQYRDSTTSTFPPEWLAHTADNQPVSQWPNSQMANFADTAPRVGGQLYAEYAAHWVIDKVWSTGLWDGVFLDVWGDRIYGANHASWDVDGDGVDDSEQAIFGVDGPWERGITVAEKIMRAGMPNALLIANGDRTLLDQRLDGRAFESFADQGADRDPTWDISHYLRVSSDPGRRSPGAMLNIDRRRVLLGDPQEFRSARFYLTATLMQDGYWAPMGYSYGELTYYDEMDGAGLGRGYLGRPLVPDPAVDRVTGPYIVGVGTIRPGVTRRDFEHGIVLNNATSEPQTIDLGGTYRKLTGKQDPTVNDGSEVTSVTLPAYDGLVLLKEQRRDG
jgi:hypothetical protein